MGREQEESYTEGSEQALSVDLPQSIDASFTPPSNMLSLMLSFEWNTLKRIKLNLSNLIRGILIIQVSQSTPLNF